MVRQNRFYRYYILFTLYLGTSLTQAQIVYELVRLEKVMATTDRRDHWTHYYAVALVEAYTGA
ncbi:MAG: hypothetical protein AAF927_11135 [Bacteroidota bacterium]